MYFLKFFTRTLSGLHLFVFPLEVYCFLAHVPFARKCNVQSVKVKKILWSASYSGTSIEADEQQGTGKMCPL